MRSGRECSWKRTHLLNVQGLCIGAYGLIQRSQMRVLRVTAESRPAFLRCPRRGHSGFAHLLSTAPHRCEIREVGDFRELHFSIMSVIAKRGDEMTINRR